MFLSIRRATIRWPPDPMTRARSVDAVTAAVVDLPYSAVHRHSGGIPPWLAGDLATAVGAVLTAHQP